jgi:hypothetical protein
VDVATAAQRWGRTWERAWPARDADAIAALYAPGASYRSHPHRHPEDGGVRAYVTRTFAEEDDVECRFGEPVASGDRAAVEWWATFVEDGQPITLSGTTVLRFDAAGLVTDHVDYWVQGDGRVLPYPGWACRTPPGSIGSGDA